MVKDKIRSTTFSAWEIPTTDNPTLRLFSKCPRSRELSRTLIILDRVWFTAPSSVSSFRIVVLPGDGIGADHLYNHR
jgi:hypothetical protein